MLSHTRRKNSLDSQSAFSTHSEVCSLHFVSGQQSAFCTNRYPWHQHSLFFSYSYSHNTQFPLFSCLNLLFLQSLREILTQVEYKLTKMLWYQSQLWSRQDWKLWHCIGLLTSWNKRQRIFGGRWPFFPLSRPSLSIMQLYWQDIFKFGLILLWNQP